MKSILLFSRCQLVHLYGSIDKFLRLEFDITHLAYSSKEKKILEEKYGIEKVILFKEEVEKVYNLEKLDLNLCNEIDSLIIKNSNSRFCLNSAIQSDRTFKSVTYRDSLVLSQVYYKFWKSFFLKRNIDFIIHEPNSLFFNQIASILSVNYGIKYLTQIQVAGNKEYNWIFVRGDDGFPVEVSNYINDNNSKDSDIERVKSFLLSFRKDKEALLSQMSKEIKSNYSLVGFIKDIIIITIRHLKNSLSHRKQTKKDSLLHVEMYLSKGEKSFLQNFRNKVDYYFQLKYDSFDDKEIFYFYPLHLEPEAVVLYWGDGIYENQTKLIENIASQLPPNCFLYVKDHPHGGDYRDYSDYSKIQAIKNVKLLNPKLSGREIISKSKGVITINGSAGFEAILMNKQVFTFGNSFYNVCDRVIKIDNIRSLRKLLYKNYSIIHKDDSSLYSFVDAYLKSVHAGFTVFFSDYVEKFNIDIENNAEVVANEMSKYLGSNKSSE